MLLASSGDVEYVMAQVGHADAETTIRIYSQLLKRAKRDHGTAFDTLVNEAREDRARQSLAAHRSNWRLIGRGLRTPFHVVEQKLGPAASKPSPEPVPRSLLGGATPLGEG